MLRAMSRRPNAFPPTVADEYADLNAAGRSSLTIRFWAHFPELVDREQLVGVRGWRAWSPIAASVAGNTSDGRMGTCGRAAVWCAAAAVTVIVAVGLLTPVALSANKPNYKDEFFDWVWMPCMYHLAEKSGADMLDLHDVAVRLHSRLLRTVDYDELSWETEKVVTGLSVEDRAETYRYLRNECAGGHVDSVHLPEWRLGESSSDLFEGCGKDNDCLSPD